MFACSVLALALTAPPSQLKVGFGETDVTPDIKKPVYLAGFGADRKATSVHDPIMARAVVLADGADTVALVSVDVVGLFLPTVESVRAKLPGFKYVLVSATHNHEGPDTMGLWGPFPFSSGIDPEYMKRVEAGIVSAVTAASKSLVAATAEYATAAGPELLHDAREPYVKHDTIGVLRFRADGKTVGLLVNWHCHPETLASENTAVSADYVYATVAVLKAKHGCPVAYFTGTVGGLLTSLRVPVKDDAGVELKDGTFEKTERYGRKVAELSDKALESATPVALTPFTIRTRATLVPIDNHLYRLAWQVGKLKRPMYKMNADPAAKLVESKNPTDDPAVRTEVGYLTFGDVDIAAIPGEIYPELVLGKVQDPADPGADFPTAAVEPAVYPAMKSKHKMLIGLANDELGYFIPKRQWDEQKPYCYRRNKPQYGEENSCGPESAAVICRVFRELAK